jgi:hypothetical protein
MGSKRIAPSDEAVGAQLLWQMKVIATKEVESLPVSIMHSFFLNETPSLSSHDSEEESTWDVRGRAVSMDSVDMVTSASSMLSSKSISFIDMKPSLPSSLDCMEHYDWSKRASSSSAGASPSLLPNPKVVITQKYGKRKRENFIGRTSKAGIVRATLRKKFSWKQYPEVSCPREFCGIS